MTPTLRGVLIGIGVVLVGLILFVGGMVLGRFGWGIGGYGPLSMMSGYGPNTYSQGGPGSVPCRFGMMESGMTLAPGCPPALQVAQCGGAGVSCNNVGVHTDTVPSGFGMMGPSMMGGGFGPGMMGGSWSNAVYNAVEPLSLDEAQAAVEDYLAALANDDLVLREVMIFDNHAYAEVAEKSTGIGAFELLVNPVTRTVSPEPGPNMMWNIKYGHMGGFGMAGMMGDSGWSGRGGMMGFGGVLAGVARPVISDEMPVSPDEAVQATQRYLDRYLPGTQVEDEADTFYGYYTLHILRDGQTVGMLSVNGYTGQVFPHTWHGDFLEMSEDMHS